MYAWRNNHQFLVVESSLAAWLAWQASRALIFKKQKPCTHVSHVRTMQACTLYSIVLIQFFCQRWVSILAPHACKADDLPIDLRLIFIIYMAGNTGYLNTTFKKKNAHIKAKLFLFTQVTGMLSCVIRITRACQCELYGVKPQ